MDFQISSNWKFPEYFCNEQCGSEISLILLLCLLRLLQSYRKIDNETQESKILLLYGNIDESISIIICFNGFNHNE